MAAVNIRPSVTFEVEKIIDVSVGTGNVNNYQVQWAPTWVSGLNLLGCEHLIEQFLHDQDRRLKQIQRQQKNLQQQQQQQQQKERKQQQHQQQQQQKQQQYGKKKKVTGITNTMCSMNDHEIKRDRSCSQFHSATLQRLELRGSCGRSNHLSHIDNNAGIKSESNALNIESTSLTGEIENIASNDGKENDTRCDAMKSEIDILQEENFDDTAPSLREVNCVVDPDLSSSNHLDNAEPLCNSSLESSLLEPDKVVVKNEEVMVVNENNSDDDDGDPLTSEDLDISLQDNSPIMHCDTRTMATGVLDGHFYESPASHSYNNENYHENILYNNEMPGFQISDIHSSGSGTSGGEEKAYKCDLCNKSYSTKNNLNRHQRLHTDPKPYMCHICEKPFSRNDNMLKHQRLYAFACTQCKTHFTTQESLEQHMLSFHNIIT